jgi:hypothetical protein
MNPCDYFLWGCLKDRLNRTKPRTVLEMGAETEAIAEEITGDMLRDAVDDCGSFTAIKRGRWISY